MTLKLQARKPDKVIKKEGDEIGRDSYRIEIRYKFNEKIDYSRQARNLFGFLKNYLPSGTMLHLKKLFVNYRTAIEMKRLGFDDRDKKITEYGK